MEDIKKIQEFFSNPSVEIEDDKIWSRNEKDIIKLGLEGARDWKKGIDINYGPYKDEDSFEYMYWKKGWEEADLNAAKLSEAKEEDAVDTITMDIPLFLRMLEYAREDAQEDMDLHDVTEKANLLGKERGILQMEDYNEIVGTAEDTPIQEMIKSALNGKVLKRKK